MLLRYWTSITLPRRKPLLPTSFRRLITIVAVTAFTACSKSTDLVLLSTPLAGLRPHGQEWQMSVKNDAGAHAIMEPLATNKNCMEKLPPMKVLANKDEWRGDIFTGCSRDSIHTFSMRLYTGTGATIASWTKCETCDKKDWRVDVRPVGSSHLRLLSASGMDGALQVTLVDRP